MDQEIVISGAIGSLFLLMAALNFSGFEMIESSVSRDKALETGREQLEGEWKLNSSEKGETFEFYFLKNSSTAEIEVTENDEVAEIEVNREPDGNPSFTISREDAVEIAESELGRKWNHSSTEKTAEGVYRLSFLRNDLVAEFDVDGSSGDILEKEVELVPESEIEE